MIDKIFSGDYPPSETHGPQSGGARTPEVDTAITHIWVLFCYHHNKFSMAHKQKPA